MITSPFPFSSGFSPAPSAGTDSTSPIRSGLSPESNSPAFSDLLQGGTNAAGATPDRTASKREVTVRQAGSRIASGWSTREKIDSEASEESTVPSNETERDPAPPLAEGTAPVPPAPVSAALPMSTITIAAAPSLEPFGPASSNSGMGSDLGEPGLEPGTQASASRSVPRDDLAAAGLHWVKPSHVEARVAAGGAALPVSGSAESPGTDAVEWSPAEWTNGTGAPGSSVGGDSIAKEAAALSAAIESSTPLADRWVRAGSAKPTALGWSTPQAVRDSLAGALPLAGLPDDGEVPLTPDPLAALAAGVATAATEDGANASAERRPSVAPHRVGGDRGRVRPAAEFSGPREGGERAFAERSNPNGVFEKKDTLVDTAKVFERNHLTVGTEAANGVAPMRSDSLITPSLGLVPSSSSPLTVGDVRVVEGSAPWTAVSRVLDAADVLWATDRAGVDLKLQLDGEGVWVRVDYRDGEVTATFRADSPELRDRLTAAWQQHVAAVGDQRPYRFSEPVFSASGHPAGGSLSSHTHAEGDASRRGSGGREAPGASANDRLAGSPVLATARGSAASEALPLHERGGRNRLSVFA